VTPDDVEIAREVEAELRFHIEMRTRANIEGKAASRSLAIKELSGSTWFKS
jgi:hypothetical protein